MEVNNVFSVPRFGAYLKKHIVDNLRLYMMSVFVLTGLLVIVMLCTVYLSSNPPTLFEMLPFYMIFMCVTGMLFTSFSFIQMADKAKGIDYLLLPASHLEKFLTTLLITTVGFMIVFHTAFFMSILIGSGLLSLRDSHVHFKYGLEELRERPNEWVIIYYIWFVLQSFYLLGAVYFHKFSIMKTTFSLFAFIIILALVNALIANIFFGHHVAQWIAGFPFVEVVIRSSQENNYTRELVLPKGMLDTYIFIGKYLIPPALWTLTYFRLKDKEI